MTVDEIARIDAKPLAGAFARRYKQVDVIIGRCTASAGKVEHRHGGKSAFAGKVMKRKSAHGLIGMVRRSSGSQEKFQLDHDVVFQWLHIVEGSDEIGDRSYGAWRIVRKDEVAARSGEGTECLTGRCRGEP